MARTRRNPKTRNQLRREAVKTAIMVAVFVVGWLICTHMFLTAWASHPAEQPVSGSEYLQSLQAEVDVYVYSR